jgi:hypothetical protein
MVSATSKKLLKELPSQAEMEQTFFNLAKTSSDHVIALMGSSYLENALERILVANLRTLNKEDHKRMFDGSSGAILGTASAKIRMAYAMRLITDDNYEGLKLINDIRNVFAHTLHHVSFDHDLVKADCVKLHAFGSGLSRPSRPGQIYLNVVAYCYGIMLGKLHRMGLAKALEEYPGQGKPKTSPDTPSQPSRKTRRRLAASKKPQRPPGSSQG